MQAARSSVCHVHAHRLSKGYSVLVASFVLCLYFLYTFILDLIFCITFGSFLFLKYLEEKGKETLKSLSNFAWAENSLE